MRAITLDRFGAAPGLRDDLPEPTLAERQVLVRVRASSVNPVDAAIAGGMLRGMAEYVFPVILGRDYAGVVEQVGAGTSRYAAGDEVFGFVVHANPTVHDGTWTELIVVPEDVFIGRKPSSVDIEAAGAAALAGITAIAGFDALGVSEGDTVLVVGATGGVGSFAVQLLAHTGATVIAPALPEDEEYLRSLGVSELLDRNSEVANAARGRHPEGVDSLLDVVSYSHDEFNANAAALKPGGRGASPISAAGEGPGRSNVGAIPSPENIERVAGLLDAGVLRVPIQSTYGLEESPEALNAVATTHKQGKLAIQVA